MKRVWYIQAIMFALLSAVLFAFSLLPSSYAASMGVTVLNAGTSYNQGSVEGMTWQASGYMTHGCSSNPSSISDCFYLTLSSNPNAQLDPGNWTNRQRNELHFPPQADGSTWTYKWKAYLATGTGTTAHFFHLMQVFSGADDGPVVTLDAKHGDVEVDCPTNTCGGTALISNYEGHTTLHILTLTSGSSGSINYAVTNADTAAAIVSYTASGYMGSGTYIKFGTYRATQNISTGVTAYVGDFSSSKQ